MRQDSEGRNALSQDPQVPGPDQQLDITELARQWSGGEPAALDRLIELAYPTLRRLARRQLRSSGGNVTLDTTALVHEAFLRMAPETDQDRVWPSRSHFYAFCAKIMRRTVIDFARRRQAEKRGGTWVRVPFEDDTAAVEQQCAHVLRVRGSSGPAGSPERPDGACGGVPILWWPLDRGDGRCPQRVSPNGGPGVDARPGLSAPGPSERSDP